MAESRSQQFIKLNLSVLNVLKERNTSDRDLSNKIDWLTKELYQVERVEFKRPKIAVPNDQNDEKAHQYENPMLLKFPTEPKHSPLQIRSSSPFEDKSRLTNVLNEPRVPARAVSPFEEISKYPTPPHLRAPETRSNLSHESNPALPPRSELNRRKPDDDKPAARSETPVYFNIPKQPPGSNNPKYTPQKSRENKNTNQPIKVLEPLPMRFKEQPPQPEKDRNYVNIPELKASNAYFQERNASGVIGELKFTPYNNERVNTYETKGEPMVKKLLPQQGVGMNFEDTGEGRTIIDEEIRYKERQGFHAAAKMPTSPPFYRPPLPPPYLSQGSRDPEDQNMIHISSAPILPPKGLPKIGNNNFATNAESNSITYVNVLDQLKEKTRREHFFDTMPKPDAANRTEDSGEQMKPVRPPVMKEQGPQKAVDDYGYLILKDKDEVFPSPGIYEEISDTRGEGILGVFNMRDLISEKTELMGSDNVTMKRGVLIDKVTSKDESEFYELISNKAMFFLYITDDNILTQELLSLSNALYIELHSVLAPFYKFNFQKLKVSLGPAVGLLETANSNTKKKGVFQNMMGKKGDSLEIGKSLQQMRITTSHIIYLSQSGAEFDEASFERYMNERDQNLIEHFQRSFIPLIQGAQPLSKRRVSDLTVYLGSIYKFKDYQRMIPDTYKHDAEMLADITTSLNLCHKSSPEELMPQVIELAEASRFRNSVYFRVKVNNKMPKRMNDTILGISLKNIHLIDLSQNEDIVCYIWASADIEQWSNIGGLTIEFKDGQKLLLSSPENEKMIHEILKMRVKPKKMLVNY